ncbi:alpha/beta hydrolase [Nonomuraea typhae]|uniref:alpha/beta hydrolase n=1 Tax=Nonomuraea typhae TaxID=2603600 RepID=UPI0012FCAD7C|nr:alpha/beta hydrolase [Nonomuraea typhae]
MPDHSAAQETLARVTALAVAHHTLLDGAARLMAAHAWTGGGAPAFAATLERHRRALQTSLADACRALATTATAPPALSTAIPPAHLAPGAFHGIDPQAMAALITTLDEAAHALPALATQVSTALTAHGLSPTPAHRLTDVATWSATQATDLRRRLSRIRSTAPGAPIPAALAAHTLFAAHTTTAPLLSRLTGGDQNALQSLLNLQETAQDPALAARINAWWHDLDAPPYLPRMGLLNGLPSKTRDQANRHLLATEKTRLTTALNEISHHPADMGQWEKIANQLRRLTLIEEQLRPHDGYPAPLLLAFDLTGQGRLIISWGNPDTADTTVTAVSGLTSGLDAAKGDLQRSRALWLQASKTSGEQTIATITWLGYDAPQIDPGLWHPARSVAFETAAKTGAAALASFTDGLRASHQPSGTARAVLIGHSYGSLTTGHAATLRPGKLADTLILIGSPGVGVNHAGDLGLNPKHVWVGEAGGDPVTTLGRFGTDPGTPAFGAQHIPIGRTTWTTAHSSYWDPDSPSLRNMGHIINGQYEDLIQPAPLNTRPQLLMPEAFPDIALESG